MLSKPIRRVVGALFVLVLSFSSACAESLVVFAASSMTDAITDMVDAFEQDSGETVVLSFASSSVLAKQIEHGAPAGVFISANPAWMDYVQDLGLIVTDSRHDIAQNRLALIAPTDSTVAVDLAQPESFLGALGPNGRLAVGDPSHVPAGQYAREALQALGLWHDLETRLAPAANVRGAVALVERNEAPLGIVYRTDAEVTDRIKVLALFPAWTHERIVYPAARVVSGDDPLAEAFLDFILSDAGQDILIAHGFLPGFDESCGCFR